MAFDEKTAARVRQLLEQEHRVTTKSLMGKCAFMVGGAMCCSVGPDSILFRIHPDDTDAVLAMPHVKPMVMGKRTMKGFVRVSPEGYRTDAMLRGWLTRGVEAGEKATTESPRKTAARKKAPARTRSRPT